MQTTNTDLLFQTSSDIIQSGKRQKKAAALAKRGNPISVPGKILDARVRGNEVIVGESGGSARRIDLESGTIRRVFKGHEGPVACVALLEYDLSHRSSTALVTGSWDKTIRLWDLESGKSAHILRGHSDFVKHLLPLGPPHNLLISTSSDKLVRVWDLLPLQTGGEPQCVQVLRNHTRPVLCCVARRTETLSIWTGDSMGVVIEWTFKDRQLSLVRTVTCHETSVTGMVIDEEGLWTSSIDKTAQFRSWTAFDKPSILHHPAYVTCILPLPPHMAQDVVLTGSDDGNIRAWSVEGRVTRLLAMAEGHDGQVSILSLAQGPNGAMIISCGLDKTIRRWTVQDLLHPPPLLLDEESGDANMTEEEERELEELMS